MMAFGDGFGDNFVNAFSLAIDHAAKCDTDGGRTGFQETGQGLGW
jgi:hypothetical protein